MPTLDLSLLTRNERSSLALALEMTADFLGIKKPDFAAPVAFAPDSEDASQASSVTPQRPLVIPPEMWERPGVAKFRERVASSLYADDLRADLVDRAVYAVAAKLTTRHDLNRLIHVAVSSAADNARKGKEPTRAWLLFYPALKAVFDANGVDFPKMGARLEPEPETLARKREEDERLKRRVAKTMEED